MIKKLIKPSLSFKSFILALGLNISKPQSKHIIRIGESLIVSEGTKTLSALYREWVDAPDVSAAADFLSQSPWQSKEIDDNLKIFIICYLLAKVKGKPVITISLDDSTTRKNKDTNKLEVVDWVFDHAGAGKGQTIYCKGAVHLNLRVQIGKYGFNFSWRFYLKKDTVRTLNRYRTKENRIKFKTKNNLACEMLKELKSFLPNHFTVYVLFDRWYSSAKLIKFIHEKLGWHIICAIKSNRKLNGTKMTEWAKKLRHRQYIRVTCTAADGTNKTYLVRKVQGRFSRIPFDVCVLLSKRHKRAKSSQYFLCTDLNLRPQEILNLYNKRWSIEVDYWYLKQYLGLGDFRVQSYEAACKWYSIVHLVLTFLQWKLYEALKGNTNVKSVADIIRLHREEHAWQLVKSICEETLRTGSVDKGMEPYILKAACF